MIQIATQKTYLRRKVHRKEVKSRFDLTFACLARYDQVASIFRFYCYSYGAMLSFKVNILLYIIIKSRFS